MAWRTLTDHLREEAADAALGTGNEERRSVCQTRKLEGSASSKGHPLIAMIALGFRVGSDQ